MVNTARNGYPGVATGRLGEHNLIGSDERGLYQIGEGHGGEGDPEWAHVQPGGAQPTLPGCALVGDPAVFDLDPAVELIGKPYCVRRQ
jgi:hypothetical protein